MNLSFAIKTEDSPMIMHRMIKMNTKLQSGQGMVFSGAVRNIGKGYYIVGLDLVGGLFMYVLGPLLLTMAALVAILIGLVRAANVFLFAAVVGVVIVSMLLSPAFYRLILRLRFSILKKRPVSVKKADQDVLRMVAYGEV